MKSNTPALRPTERRILNRFSKVFPDSTVEFVSPEATEESRNNSQHFSEFCDALTADVQSMKNDTELLHRHRSPDTWTRIMKFNQQPAFYVQLPSADQRPVTPNLKRWKVRASKGGRMRHFSKIKNSSYLTRIDIQKPTSVTITEVREEEVGQEKTEKYVLYFEEFEKGLV